MPKSAIPPTLTYHKLLPKAADARVARNLAEIAEFLAAASSLRLPRITAAEQRVFAKERVLANVVQPPPSPAARAPPTPLTRKIYATSCSCGQQKSSRETAAEAADRLCLCGQISGEKACEKAISSAPGSWTGVQERIHQPALDDSGCDAAAAAT